MSDTDLVMRRLAEADPAPVDDGHMPDPAHSVLFDTICERSEGMKTTTATSWSRRGPVVAIAVLVLVVAAGAVIFVAGAGESEPEVAAGPEVSTAAQTEATGSVVGQDGSGTGPVTEEQLVGVWYTRNGDFEVLNADGTYGAGGSPEDAMDGEYDFGMWTLEGSTFTYITDPDAPNCTRVVTVDPLVREGQIGRYEISVSANGDELYRDVIDDACSIRVRDVTPSVTRHLGDEE